MPKRLSDPAWLAFQNDIDLDALKLPSWGAVVQWGQQLILVYICPGTGSLCRQGEVMLSDVSDRPDLVKNIPGTYDTNQDLWVYHIPQELLTRTAQMAQATLESTGMIIQTVAQTTGAAAGALTKPLLENLTIPLIVVAVAYLFLMTPHRQ